MQVAREYFPLVGWQFFSFAADLFVANVHSGLQSLQRVGS